VRLENGNGFSALNQHGFVRLEFRERFDYAVKTLPVPTSFSSSSIDNESFRILGHLWIDNVAEHAQNAFNLPILAVQFLSGQAVDGLL
jgi:hypothetical protein